MNNEKHVIKGVLKNREVYMKRNKILIIALVTLSLCMGFLYAADEDSTVYHYNKYTNDGVTIYTTNKESYEALSSNTDTTALYQENDGELIALGGEITNPFAYIKTKASLDDEEKSIILYADVAGDNLQALLYYGNNNVTDNIVNTDGSLSTTEANSYTDANWNVQNGFTTGIFTVVVEGATSSEEEIINVTVTTEPFVLITNQGEKSTVIKGGDVAVITTDNIAKEWTISDRIKSKYTQEVGPLSAYTYFDGYQSDITPFADNHESGNVATFKLRAASADETLPTGRYESVVSVLYEFE